MCAFSKSQPNSTTDVNPGCPKYNCITSTWPGVYASIEKLHSLVSPLVPFLIERPLIVGDGLNPLSSPLTFTDSPAQFNPTIPGYDAFP